MAAWRTCCALLGAGAFDRVGRGLRGAVAEGVLAGACAACAEALGTVSARLSPRIARSVTRTAVRTDAGTSLETLAQPVCVDTRPRPPSLAVCSSRASALALTPKIFATSWRLKPWCSPIPVRRTRTSVCLGASDERHPLAD